MDFADSSIITMAEASSGSRNPAESPTATQLCIQGHCRYPELIPILRKLNPAESSPPRYDRSSARAPSSDIWLLEYTYPTPRRVVSPISHTHPADRAVESVAEAIGTVSSRYGTCTAQALLTNNTSFAARNGTP